MRRKSFWAASLLACAALLAFSATVGGTGVEPEEQPDYTDHLEGIEISPGIIIKGVRVGTAFVGWADGDLPGTWAISFRYSPPHPGPGIPNVILGGAWSLAVRQSGRVVGRLYGNVEEGMALWNPKEEPEEAAVCVHLSILGGTGRFSRARGEAFFEGTLSHEPIIPRLEGDIAFFLDD